jgi:hypothetical protein
MKKMKFRKTLCPAVHDGTKTTTWRLFDDKDLSVGDEVSCVIAETGEIFASIRLTRVSEKTLGTITDADRVGHEPYASSDEMYRTLSDYYHRDVDDATPVKVITFELI